MKPNRTESVTTQGRETDLLRPEIAARFLGVSNRTLKDWRMTGTGPKFIRLSPRAVRYRRSDIELWLEARTKPASRRETPRIRKAS